MKFYGMVGHNPETNRLDFDGNLDPDQGIFGRNFTILKAPHRQRS